MAERRAQVDAAGVVAGVALFLVTWRLALREELHDHEVYVMGAMNTQPAVVHGPLAVVMQLGSLGGGLAVAGVLGLCGQRRAGLTTGAAVTLSWLGAKGVKEVTRRGRPADHLEDIVVRGRTQSGFGFPSGHAAISAAAAVAASPLSLCRSPPASSPPPPRLASPACMSVPTSRSTSSAGSDWVWRWVVPLDSLSDRRRS